MAELMLKKCEHCGAEFETDRVTKRFCTRICKCNAHHTHARAEREAYKEAHAAELAAARSARIREARQRWAKASAERRFWSKVQKTDGCWIWTGNRDVYGYGVFRSENKLWKAHRAALFFTHGHVNPSLGVLHGCDNPACVNPAHLREGTQLDNVKDAYEHGKLSRKTPEELHAMAVRRANIRWGNEVAL